MKRRYDLTANMYNERYAEEQEAKYHAALAEAAPKGLVLDLGCATGLLFRHIASKADKIIGIDVSKILLFHAMGYSKELGNVHLIQADADHLPFKNSAFATVFAFTVLQNMPKPLVTLLEIHRTAKDGAMVTVTGLKKTMSREALRTLLQKAGFRRFSILDKNELKCYVASGIKTGSK